MHNCVALDDLEKDVRTAAQLGQVGTFLCLTFLILSNVAGPRALLETVLGNFGPAYVFYNCRDFMGV